ncbi:tfiih basal transcription factor complex p44 subunit [Stemphylium lycopersici]|uniref:Tfiih basal transcription factor complex p44 subunit n=1 Tax=Stemphylium lycopersici TaxID=183478 RepID=A0A364MZJ9_STELY|nr:tfiih basal transcription factor complex p44 subunit [Stemphylium lycopersici]
MVNSYGEFSDFCRDSGNQWSTLPGSIILCGIAILVSAFLLWRSQRKKAAVGRREMQLFLLGYVVISICEIFTIGGFPLNDTVRIVFVAIHIGAITATSWILMLNGAVGYQLLDDGTAVSIGLLLISSLIIFVGTGYIALDTGLGWTDFWNSTLSPPNQAYALYTLYQLVPLFFIVVFFLLEAFLVLRILGERKPMLYLLTAALLFAISQVFQYVISVHICNGTDGKINGGLFSTLFTLLSVVMIWVFWRMADSDYDFEDEVSDDEYVGTKNGTSSTRAQSTAASKRRKVEVPAKEAPRRQAWETEYSRTVEKTIQPADDGTLGQSVQEREEERKRKRLRKDTKPFQRGIIRHVVLVLDLSEAMMEKDMRPNRFITMVNYTQDYVREFFEQNPISQMSVLGMHDGVCIRVSELSGNPAEHVAAIQGLRSKDDGKEPKGSPSLQNALELARATLYHTPSHGTREVIVVFGSLLSLDPGDIHQSVKACVRDRIRVSVIGMSARLKICTEIVRRTNAGDESEYTIATDQEMLKELLLATTTPPVIRQSAPADTTVAAPPAQSSQSAAALMMMGFPSRVVEDQLTINPPSKNKEDNEAEQNGEANGTKKDEDDGEEQKASESGRPAFTPRYLGSTLRVTFSKPTAANFGSTARAMAAFERLIRFEDTAGKIVYGNLDKETPTKEIEGSVVEVLDGDVKSGFKKTGGKATVGKLLCPLPTTNIIHCVGLNYRRHAEECNLQIPTHPAIFTKPSDALAGPLESIPIPSPCQSQLDYEGELTLVIGRDCKNVAAADYRSVLLGYTVGNDISARNYQLPASVSGGQFGYAKSFDKFAPIGPCIVSTQVLPDPQKLGLQTRVNGQLRQQTGTDDMIYSIGQVVEHLSRGTTLRAGTVILTGTPSGVGLFMEPKGFLADGDTVEVYVEGIGSLVNKVVFE